MTEEAREAAEAVFPETEWSQRATILAMREAFIRGYEQANAAGVAEGIRLAREAARAGFDELSGNIGANAHDQMWMKSGATVISAKLEKLTTRD